MLAKARQQLLVPILAILLALVVGAVIMVLSSPLIDGQLDWTIWITAYKALIEGSVGSVNAMIQTLVEAAPLILAGLAVGTWRDIDEIRALPRTVDTYEPRPGAPIATDGYNGWKVALRRAASDLATDPVAAASEVAA